MAAVATQDAQSPRGSDGGKSFQKLAEPQKARRVSLCLSDKKSDVGRQSEGGRRLAPSVSTNESVDTPILRRRNTFKGFAQSITGLMQLRRLTMGKLNGVEHVAKPKVKIENTYKTEPDKGKTFNPERVAKVALEVIEREMGNAIYNHASSGQRACDLAQKVKVAVKELRFPRYKIICQVVLGEDGCQGIEAASRCVWDEKHDNYTSVNFRNGSLFVSAMIYGIYFD